MNAIQESYLIAIIMIVNDVVANLQFPLIKAYQVTEKQSTTHVSEKTK